MKLMKAGYGKVLRIVALVTVLCMVEANAYEGELDLNALVVRSELYVWNRISDFLDIFRGGVALGPGIGFEVALTDYAKLGAYANAERGVDFPHVLPPLWLVNYYSNRPVLNIHDGMYATVAFGPWRKETKSAVDAGLYFPRGEKSEVTMWENNESKWDVRAQLDFILLHAYLNVKTLELADFFCGIVGLDPKNDDQRADVEALARRKPADQFGRGLCNILFGVVEIPKNMIRVTEEEGDLPGFSKGLCQGVWRFVSREVVGVVELVSFPFGWSPIIEPEYVFENKRQGAAWKVNRPAFHKEY